MGYIFVFLVLMAMVAFFDILLDLGMNKLMYLIIVGGIIWGMVLLSDDVIESTKIENAPTEETQKIDDNIDGLGQEIKQELQEIDAELKSEIESITDDVSKETKQLTKEVTDKKTGGWIIVGFITAVVFVFVWGFSESLIVGAIVASIVYGFVHDNVSVDMLTNKLSDKQIVRVDTSRIKLTKSYINNKYRSKMKMYLHKKDGNMIISNEPDLNIISGNTTTTFDNISLTQHTNDQVYACVTATKVCYPVAPNE